MAARKRKSPLKGALPEFAAIQMSMMLITTSR
jgi:hypothetical protein